MVKDFSKILLVPTKLEMTKSINIEILKYFLRSTLVKIFWALL